MANSEREDYESRDRRRKKPEFYSKEIGQFGKGLFTDSSPQMQPKGTLRFALNCVDETEEGDMLFPSNMESNIKDSDLPQGYIPIGKIYIGKGETVLFLTTITGDSEIGIYNEKSGYSTKLNNPTLNFKITHQIDAVYRLRRGCDQTIYWTDNLNPIRQYVFNREENYLVNNIFNVELTNLFKKGNKIPNFESISIGDSGTLKAGSYNFAIQYLDSDLNPTEWFITTETINIYHSSLNKPHRELEGSSNLKNEYQNWGESTGKSIHLTLSNLDDNFNFYRIGIIEATSGTGLVSKVTASAPISVGVKSYIFTGNSETVVTVEEIAQFSNVIETAQSIEQIENKLLLGNTKGKQINFCELQQYASKIISNYVVEKVALDRIDAFKEFKEDTTNSATSSSSSKDPLINTKKLGYMPGEIYSFGISYYFADNTSSPVYHIPGRTPYDFENKSNMSLLNKIEDRYTDSSNCDDTDFWGKDFEGANLKNTNIRHHRFPTRAEAGIGFIEKGIVTEEIGTGYALVATMNYNLGSINGYGYFNLKVNGTFGNRGIKEDYTLIIFPYPQYSGVAEFEIDIMETDIPPGFNVTSYNWYSPAATPANTTVTFSVKPKTITKKEKGVQANILGIKFSNIQVPLLEGDSKIIGYKIVRNTRDENNKTILDSGLMFPVSEYKEFLGYGHSAPNMTEDANFTIRKDLYAFINPEFLFNKKEYTQSNLEFIDAGEYGKYSSFDYTQFYGNDFLIGDRIIENFVEDTYPGTTYDPEYHSGKEKDTDGLTLHTVTKFRDTEFFETSSFGNDLFLGAKIKDIFYLDSLSSNSIFIGNENKDVFNISSDNRIGIVQLEKEIMSPFAIEGLDEKLLVAKYITRQNTKGEEVLDFADNLYKNDEISGVVSSTDFYPIKMKAFFSNPYFYMRRKLSNPYNNFRYLPYYAEYTNITPVSETSKTIFSGDVYISPMTYNNTMFHDVKPKKRKTKNQTWKFIAGGLLILGGIVGAIFTGGASLTLVGAGLGLVGAAAGLSMINSGLETNKIIKIYQDEYEKGLKHISRDGTTKQLFVDNRTAVDASIIDDEIQWYNDVINGLWFETQVNIGIRQGNTAGLTSFIPSPFEFSPPMASYAENLKNLNYSNNYFRRRAVEKLSVLDLESDGGRLYLGYANAEQYDINKDLQRRNKEKPYFHLGLEYDCCSDCVETFPHRLHYSEQSFQEELTDNFRVFLPNNYIDLDGETGEITNIFKIQNELFIHTEEAVWKMPKNYQERVTDEIVSFIGTGSYFSIPPQKLVDDESGNSYGTRHKWSRLKTPSGYFFVSESQNAICMFDGNKIVNIAELGTYYWFYNNIPLLSDSENRDNPSNPLGVGFIFAYDSKKKLVYLTKVDRLPTGENTSWTMSFNLKKNSWGSWHSFLPNFYFQTSKNYFSFLNGENSIWKHNVLGNYLTYYGKSYPYILEYVLTEGPLQNKTFEDITVLSESKKYDPLSKTFYDVDNIFFDKLLVYNSRQCSGVLNIVVKDKEDIDYFMNQVSNTDLQNIIVDRNERNWTINELRDMVVTKDTPMFISDVKELQDNYFIDKKLNLVVIDYDKDWTQIESFRDKYLVVRFIFDKFVDIKLITNFSVNTEKTSIR